MGVNPFTAVTVFVLMSAGAAILFYALGRLLDAARIRGTPVSEIGAASLGWVAVSGRTRARAETEDPVLKRPCVWWRCAVEMLYNEGVESRRPSDGGRAPDRDRRLVVLALEGLGLLAFACRGEAAVRRRRDRWARDRMAAETGSGTDR
jgi:hypothetical protein